MPAKKAPAKKAPAKKTTKVTLGAGCSLKLGPREYATEGQTVTVPADFAERYREQLEGSE